MDITVKLVGGESGIAGIYSPESMANVETFHGLCGILGNGVFTGGQLSASELRELNAQLESFCGPGEKVPSLYMVDGVVSNESVEETLGWLKEKVSGIAESVKSSIEACKKWWEEYRNKWVGLKRRVNALSGDHEITPGDVKLGLLKNPSLLFEDGQRIQDLSKTLIALDKTTHLMLDTFAIPYFASVSKLYKEVRDIPVFLTRNQEKFNEVIELYKRTCEESRSIEKFIGNYPGGAQIRHAERKESWLAGNFKKLLTSYEFRDLNPVRVEFVGMSSKERELLNSRHLEDTVQKLTPKEIAGLCSHYEGVIDKTINDTGHFESLWSGMTTAFYKAIASATFRTGGGAAAHFSNGPRVVGLMSAIHNDNKDFYSVVVGMCNLNYNFAENYVRLAEKSVRG